MADGQILFPTQICFIVEDLEQAKTFCEQQLGWGPFVSLQTQNPAAYYQGQKTSTFVEFCLGMAGAMQIELIRIREGINSAAEFQSRYRSGLHHIGVHCDSRDAAQEHLAKLGSNCREIGEVVGVRYGFADAPDCAWGLFELLQSGGGVPEFAVEKRPEGALDYAVDRATLVVEDIAPAGQFMSRALQWDIADIPSAIIEDSYEFDGAHYRMQRLLHDCGRVELEIIQPLDDDPVYSAHLQRRREANYEAHGFIHIGSLQTRLPTQGTTHVDDSIVGIVGQWKKSQERFLFLHGPDNNPSVQLRTVA